MAEDELFLKILQGRVIDKVTFGKRGFQCSPKYGVEKQFAADHN